MSEAAVPGKERAGKAVAMFEMRGGQSTKTRCGMAAAGEQPTAANTGRMLLVESVEPYLGDDGADCAGDI